MSKIKHIFSVIQYTIYGAVCFQFTHSLAVIERIYILCLIIIIKSEVWTITHCLGLGHETMVCTVCFSIFFRDKNKGNLRDLRADRPSDIKWDSNRPFSSPFDLEIWWMTSKNNRELLLYYVKLCASFQTHLWIRTGVTVRKRSIRIKIADILSGMIFQFDGWPWKTIGHLFYSTSSLVHLLKSVGEVKL